jgi:hypothetical protein
MVRVVREDDVSDERHPDGRPVHLSADEARGGEIILRTRARRLIFLAGIAGIVILAVLIRLFAYR